MSGGRKIVACCLTLVALNLGANETVLLTPAQTTTYQANLTQTNSPPGVPEKFVNAGNTKLHYVDRGNGRPVVMIHGNAGDLNDFEFGATDLLTRTYRTIAFDLPGHGLSKMPGGAKGTIQEQAVTLHQAITALGVKDPILVGHSWGGGIALAYALLYPHDISALVLLAPAAYADHHRDAPMGFFLRVPLLSDIALFFFKPILGRRLLNKGLKDAFAPDPVPAEYLNAVTRVWLDQRHLKAFIKHDAKANSSLLGLSPRYQKINARVIIVTGDSDREVSATQNALDLHLVIANSALLVIPNAGHQIPQMYPEDVLRAVDMAALGAPTSARRSDQEK